MINMKKGVWFLIAIVLFSGLVFFTLGFKEEKHCGELLNVEVAEDKVVDYNYVHFIWQGEVVGKIMEKNGWLLLEMFLETVLEKEHDPILEDYLQLHNPSGPNGWWTDDFMRTGKKYFKGKESVQLFHDSDDSAWVHKIHGKSVSDEIAQLFISDEALPSSFDATCKEIECNRSLIIRVWSSIDWHDDIDIIVGANMITSLNNESVFQRKILLENVRFINHLIENKNVNEFFKYYEPSYVGVGLLLLYDREYVPFLSERSRKILKERLREEWDISLSPSLVARWGGGEDIFYGCIIATVNERVPLLLRQYMKEQSLLGESS